MASDEIGKGGDTISREQAIRELLNFGQAHTYSSENADLYRGFDNGVNACLVKIRALPSIAPDPIEDEYREAAQAHGEADIEIELCSCDGPVECSHWHAMVLTRARLIAARAARDGAR